MLKFYYSPGACSLASHIALEEAAAEFEPIRVDLFRNQQRQPDFLGLNAKGRIPVLQTERGILTENPAILSFIAMTYPAARLAPLDDPFELARLQAFNAYLSSTVHVAHAHGPRGSRWADDPSSLEDMKRKVPETMSQAFRLIEEEYLGNPWVMGSQYSTADMYLYTLATWLEADGVDIKQFPRVIEHREKVMNRAAVQRTLTREKAPVS